MVDKKTIIVVVITAIIVAAITALVVGSITGNAIKLNQDRYGAYKVYTVDDFNKGVPVLISGDSAKFRDVNFNGGSVSNDWGVGNNLQSQNLLVLDNFKAGGDSFGNYLIETNISQNIIKVRGDLILTGFSNNPAIPGNKYLCIDNNGRIWVSTTNCR